MVFLPKKFGQRIKIQSNRKIKPKQFEALLVKEIPPTYKRLRHFAAKFGLGSSGGSDA